MDYDFLLCRILSEFGWSLEYALNLTYPVFVELGLSISRIRADRAVEEFLAAYTGGKYGGKCLSGLYERRGDLFIASDDKEQYTQAQYAEAERVAEQLIRNLQAEGVIPNAKTKQGQ